MDFKHNDLCLIAVKWLKRPASQNGHGCHIAISEPRTYGECPDAIGFRHGDHEGGSVVVEVKMSRADFLADFKKPHREGGGMGLWRYYMCPVDLIKPDEVPLGWGLLYVNTRGHIKAIRGAVACNNKRMGTRKESMSNGNFQFSCHDWKNEQGILIRWLARIGNADELALKMREANNALQRQVKENERLREEMKRLELQNCTYRERDRERDRENAPAL